MSQKHMDKLRALRGLPPQTRENLMERTRAAVAYANATNDEVVKLAGFMDIFHPRPEGYTRNDIQRMLGNGR